MLLSFIMQYCIGVQQIRSINSVIKSSRILGAEERNISVYYYSQTLVTQRWKGDRIEYVYSVKFWIHVGFRGVTHIATSGYILATYSCLTLAEPVEGVEVF